MIYRFSTLTQCCTIPAAEATQNIFVGLEAAYLADVAKQRRPVLMCIFFFDVACYAFRLLAHGVTTGHMSVLRRLVAILPQVLNMVALHSMVAWVNWRSRRVGVSAARQVHAFAV